MLDIEHLQEFGVFMFCSMMGKVNQERLAEYLGELKLKEDANEAALRGETLTRKPYVRIQPIPKETPLKRTKIRRLTRLRSSSY
ncbi:hypothetical protein Q3G72_032485 [Acer saccharum]|nr:hypothetical protein Q3G72_032485 [Acer saccharum]